jgi:hypothetical protein
MQDSASITSNHLAGVRAGCQQQAKRATLATPTDHRDAVSNGATEPPLTRSIIPPTRPFAVLLIVVPDWNPSWFSDQNLKLLGWAVSSD